MLSGILKNVEKNQLQKLTIRGRFPFLKTGPKLAIWAQSPLLIL